MFTVTSLLRGISKCKMASSKFSQDVIICQLCEVNTKITVKCLDCDLYMCPRCKETVHSKFKHADLHEIVGLKDLASVRIQNSTKSDLKTVKCMEHKHQICFMYCVECGDLVCTTCISTKHIKHELSEIDIFCREKVDNLHESSSELNTRIEKFLQEIKRIKIQETAKFSKLKDQTVKEERDAKEKIRLEYEGKLKRIETERREVDQLLTNECDSVLKNQTEVQNLSKELKTAFESKDPTRILQNVAPTDTKLKELSRRFDGKETASLRIRIGKKSTEGKIKLDIIRSFTTSSFIGSASSDEGGYMWIADKKHIMQIDTEDSRVLTSYENPISNKVTEIRCLNTMDTILFLTSSTQILKLTSRGEFKTVADLYPEVPSTIHISKNGCIIVGMNFRKKEKTIDKPVFVVFSIDGQKLTEYCNRDGKLLVHAIVQCCTSLEDGTICYNDSDYSERGRTVKLDVKGNVEWVYNGKAGYSLYPVEVLATTSDNIVVSDEKQNSLHVLTSTGNVLKLIDVTDIGIESKCGVMTLDKEGYLWISTDYEMFCLKYSGF